MLGRNGRITLPIDTVDRPRPARAGALTQDPEEFRQRTGARLIRCDEPGYGLAAAALGLALANPLSDETAHRPGARAQARADDPRHLPLGGARPPRRSPRRRLALPDRHGRRGRRSTPGGRRRARRVPLAQGAGSGQARRREEGPRGADQGDRGVSRQPGGLVRPAADHRRGRAAESTIITSLSGEAEVESGARAGPGKTKKQLVISFETPMAEDGSLPREIDGFLASLRGEPSLKRHFPLIEVSGLRANPVRQGVPPSASYSVVCLPKVEKAPTPRLEADARTRLPPRSRPPSSKCPSDLTHEPDPSEIRTRPGDPEAAPPPAEAPARRSASR